MTNALRSGMESQRVPISRRRSNSSAHLSSVSSTSSTWDRSGASERSEPSPSLQSRRRSSRLKPDITSPASLKPGLRPTAVNQQVVTALPQTQAPPAWLKLLVKAQRISSVSVFVLVVAALAVYGWTVYVQQRWGQEYRRFETLKKQERQLISGNEALKNQIAQQAESPLSGLMVPDPTNAIFLTPAAPRSAQAPARPPSSQTFPTRPLGY